jgi:hypothetical protein
MADRAAGVIGAAHAGWRGAHGGVLESTVAAMERLGADRSRIVAAIGPAIAQPSYEVDARFHDSFGPEDEAFFVPGRPGHWQFSTSRAMPPDGCGGRESAPWSRSASTLMPTPTGSFRTAARATAASRRTGGNSRSSACPARRPQRGQNACWHGRSARLSARPSRTPGGLGQGAAGRILFGSAIGPGPAESAGKAR